MNTGKVWLVGAGPGDPDLFTIGGKNALGAANVIIYDALANSFLLKFANPAAQLIYVGKIADNHALPQDEINRLLVQYASRGLKVARLKGGDPYIFGRGGEEAEYLVQHGIPFEEIPGVSSAIAAPAYAGIPLTHRDYVSAVSIITGHEKGGRERSLREWEAFVNSRATLVFLMGMRNLPQICANLERAGMDPAMPAAVVYRGASPMQKTVIGTVADIATKAEAACLANPSVIIVGKVVTLADKLAWFAQKPLLGKTIAVTRAREQASGLASSLGQLGSIVLQCPTIRIEPLSDYARIDHAIHELHRYRWLVFTSVNGVRHFWNRLAHCNRDSRALYGCKVAAIGPATAQALESMGVRPDLVPEAFAGENVAQALIQQEGGDLRDKKILIPRAQEARPALPELLSQAGAIVDTVPVYQTLPECAHVEEVVSLLEKNQLDCITFSSSSTVDNFLKFVPAAELLKHPHTVLAAIGPITAQTLARHGLKAAIQPEDYTIPALVQAIQDYFTEKPALQHSS